MKIRQNLQAIKSITSPIRRNWLNMAAIQTSTIYLDGSNLNLTISLKSRQWSTHSALIHLVRMWPKTYKRMQIRQKPLTTANKYVRSPQGLLCILALLILILQARRNSHNKFKAIKQCRAMPDLGEIPTMPNRPRSLMPFKLPFWTTMMQVDKILVLHKTKMWISVCRLIL